MQWNPSAVEFWDERDIISDENRETCTATNTISTSKKSEILYNPSLILSRARRRYESKEAVVRKRKSYETRSGQRSDSLMISFSVYALHVLNQAQLVIAFRFSMIVSLLNIFARFHQNSSIDMIISQISYPFTDSLHFSSVP